VHVDLTLFNFELVEDDEDDVFDSLFKTRFTSAEPFLQSPEAAK
jgi:hypothetical protein